MWPRDVLRVTGSGRNVREAEKLTCQFHKKTERDRAMVTILNVNRKSRGSRHREPNRRKGLRRPSAVTVAGT